MALRTMTKPVRRGRPPLSTLTETNGAGKQTAKAITIRLPPTTYGMLDAAVTSYDSDRTEVIKRAIRLLSTCLAAHNSTILIGDVDGKVKEISIVIDGVPT